MKKETKSLNLCIDIGNSLFKVALFDGDSQQSQFSCEAGELDQHLQILFLKHPIQAMIVSSTRERIPDSIRSRGEKLDRYIELDHTIPIPISIGYQTPETLGRDRIATAVAAHALYPGENVLVVDAGTCITCDLTDASGHFVGGNISPGFIMRFKAMHHFTEKLPFPPFRLPQDILGRSTSEALQNGAIRGTIYEIESFISLMEAKYAPLKLVFTGGDALYFADYFKSKIFVVQNLVLIGLNKILEHNA